MNVSNFPLLTTTGRWLVLVIFLLFLALVSTITYTAYQAGKSTGRADAEKDIQDLNCMKKPKPGEVCQAMSVNMWGPIHNWQNCKPYQANGGV